MKASTVIPEAILGKHIAVLGMTGSGKTNTSKLLVEQIVAHGGRVCILDPIKSDWWGLTSNSTGTKAGLPFYILGGPRGNVPVHGAAGKAIGEVVANGSLPLSIIDMSDFGPGEHAKFFIDFAQSLFRNAKGVMHLIVEEAHIFAPKDQRGDGNISHSIHWMSRIATGARSKGIRMIVCTQRTQKLHNDVLGSCESVIVHRLTLPRDQEPAIDWLKTNADKEAVAKITASLASLKPGEAWVCSGELAYMERVHFPRITTYDNSATPTDDDDRSKIKTAAVDDVRLRSIIGDAVAEAEANDPKKLRAENIELKRLIASKPPATPAPAPVIQKIEVPIITPSQEASMLAWIEELRSAIAKCKDARTMTMKALPLPARPTQRFIDPLKIEKLDWITKAEGNGTIGNSGKRRILTALAQNLQGLSVRKLAILTGISRTGGTWRTYMADLRREQFVAGHDPVNITSAGITALGSYQPLPTGRELIGYWQERLGDSGKRRIFDALIEHYPHSMTPEELSAATGIDNAGGTWRTYMAELRGLEIIEGTKTIKAAPLLFE